MRDRYVPTELRIVDRRDKLVLPKLRKKIVDERLDGRLHFEEVHGYPPRDDYNSTVRLIIAPTAPLYTIEELHAMEEELLSSFNPTYPNPVHAPFFDEDGIHYGTFGFEEVVGSEYGWSVDSGETFFSHRVSERRTDVTIVPHPALASLIADHFRRSVKAPTFPLEAPTTCFFLTGIELSMLRTDSTEFLDSIRPDYSTPA